MTAFIVVTRSRAGRGGGCRSSSSSRPRRRRCRGCCDGGTRIPRSPSVALLVSWMFGRCRGCRILLLLLLGFGLFDGALEKQGRIAGLGAPPGVRIGTRRQTPPALIAVGKQPQRFRLHVRRFLRQPCGTLREEFRGERGREGDRGMEAVW